MRLLPLGLAVLVSFVVLFSPDSDVPRVAINDKLVHGALFLMLAWAARWARFSPGRVLIALTAYAALSEVLQSLLPIHRDGDVRDALADVIGVGLGLVTWWALASRSSPGEGAPGRRSPVRPPG